MAVMITRYKVQQAQIITADEIIVPPLGLCGLVRLLLGGMLCRCQVSALIHRTVLHVGSDPRIIMLANVTGPLTLE